MNCADKLRVRAVLGTLIGFLSLAGPAMGCTVENLRHGPRGDVKCAGGGGSSPGVSLVKSASVTSYSASGTPITYSYLVKNTGNIDLTISVTDPHVGLSAISCPSSTLAAGVSETCTATYTTTQDDVDVGSISNTGTATGTSSQSPVSATSSLTISTVGTASLTLVKSASATSYSAEQPAEDSPHVEGTIAHHDMPPAPAVTQPRHRCSSHYRPRSFRAFGTNRSARSRPLYLMGCCARTRTD
jgi:hypothetical protein